MLDFLIFHHLFPSKAEKSLFRICLLSCKLWLLFQKWSRCQERITSIMSELHVLERRTSEVLQETEDIKHIQVKSSLISISRRSFWQFLSLSAGIFKQTLLTHNWFVHKLSAHLHLYVFAVSSFQLPTIATPNTTVPLKFPPSIIKYPHAFTPLPLSTPSTLPPVLATAL